MGQTVVMVLLFASAFFTWKWIKEFYQRNHGMILSHLVAIVTALFMFISSLILFLPKPELGHGPNDMDLNPINFVIIITMLGIIFYFFKYKPAREDEEL